MLPVFVLVNETCNFHRMLHQAKAARGMSNESFTEFVLFVDHSLHDGTVM